MRDAAHPGGPGRVVLISPERTENRFESARGAGKNSASASAPVLVIHGGDEVIVEEHTPVVDARLEAVAMGPAASGGQFRVRLTIGGKVMRAVATAPGHAQRGGSDWSAAMRAIGFAIFSACLMLAPAATGLTKKHTSVAAGTKTTPPEDALRAYIAKVREQQAAEVRTPGSLWSADAQLVRLGTDVKAFRIHDVVSIVVTESLAASTDGQVKNSRASNGEFGFDIAVRCAQSIECVAESGGRKFELGTDGAGAEHHQFEPGDDLWRRGGGCAAQRNAGGAGNAAIDLFLSRRN